MLDLLSDVKIIPNVLDAAVVRQSSNPGNEFFFHRSHGKGLIPILESNIQGIQGIDQFIQLVLWMLRLVRLALGDADGKTNGCSAVID